MPDTSAERTDSCRLGLLTDGRLSDEQRAARAAVGPRDVEVIEFDTITSPDDVAGFDVLWWHRATPLTAGSPPGAALDAVSTYVESGGGLLVSLYALSAVDDLGIDPQVPDLIEETRVPNHEWAHRPAGLLVKSRFEETPAFEAIESRRVHTQPAARESAPRLAYEQTVPRHGEVLASAVVGTEDCPSENTVLAWEHGEGQVLGVGQYLVFDEVTEPFEDAVETLLDGFVRYLAEGGDATVTGRPKTVSEIEAMRQSLDADLQRPAYHFAPPANWMNDPNGVIEWDGTYHLFYQYNPGGPYHGSIHWGHATSEDLVEWEDRPVALTPDPGEPDEHGCWSGCAIDDAGTPTFVYTGGSGKDQLPCLATATDDSLDDWEKHPENPIIETPPAELDVLSNEHWNAEFRDHDVWRADETWYHLIGSGIEDEGGTAILYTGETLLDWELVGPVLVGDRHEDGGMWECPELLRLDDLDLLQVSNYDSVVYYTGRFDGETFEREGSGVTDHGNFYAAQTMQATDGRQLSWGWIREDRDEAAQWDAGWSGLMSIPRVISTDDGTVRIEPAEEITALRESGQSHSDVTLAPDSEEPLSDLDGDALEIEVTVDLDDADAFELVVRESPDGEERTPIRYTADGELIVDRRESTLSAAAETTPQRIEDTPGEDGEITLRVFLDRSVIEVFVDGQTSLSSRIYPTRSDSTGVSVEAVGGTVEIESLDVWTLSPVADREGRTGSISSPGALR